MTKLLVVWSISCQILEFGQTIEFSVNYSKSSQNFENREILDDVDDNLTALPTVIR